jgi:hypothetical protein
MPRYDRPRDVLTRLSELRQAHGSVRADIAAKEALGLAYANGRHWTNVTAAGAMGSSVSVDVWDEDWDPRSSELRVVDNRIGPLVRRVAAGTNATRIEAQVSAPRHLQTIEFSQIARVAQMMLNGIEEDAGFTRTARNASSLRWRIGSVVLYLQLAKKRRQVPPQVARLADGSPLEVDDRWVRWRYAPLSDLVWDVGNLRPTLEDHSVLALEEHLTATQFQQVYGPLEQFGLSEDELPEMGMVAPHKVSAAGIAGSSLFESFARQSKEKGLRVITLFETDPNDPQEWPLMFTVVDITTGPLARNEVSGTVINWDDPRSPYGHKGLPLAKMDGFRRDDSVWAWGIPHVLMGHQDLLNIARSTQLQQMVSITRGMWLVDVQVAKKETFATELGRGPGTILSWDSKRSKDVAPPQFIAPGSPHQEFVTVGADLALAMRESVHVTAANLGAGKTHIPERVQFELLREGNTVIDNVLIQDADHYSSLLKTTLGTMRLAAEQPNRMLARLRDRHQLNEQQLGFFLRLDARNLHLSVQVRRHSIISRSTDERMLELNGALQLGLIDRAEHLIAMADELERPVVLAHEKQIQFIKNQILNIMEGMEWQGLPSLSFPIFERLAKSAIYELDVTDPVQRGQIGRLEAALLVQRQIAMELAPSDQVLQNGGQGGQNQGMIGQEDAFGPQEAGGPPESINPSVSPVGAAGGLPLGLGASI